MGFVGGRGFPADGGEAGGATACPTSFPVCGGAGGDGDGARCGALVIIFTFCRSNSFAPGIELYSCDPVLVVAPTAFPWDEGGL